MALSIAAGLKCALARDRSRWIPGQSSFLFPVRALSTIFRAKYLANLGRYTHPVALSNDRLAALGDGYVRFRWKDYTDHDRVKILTLATDEFIRRFLLHVVPRGFMRIRHVGLLANRTRRATLTRCRSLLGRPPIEEAASESTATLMHRLTGIDLARCWVCGEGRMQVTAIVVRLTWPPDPS